MTLEKKKNETLEQYYNRVMAAPKISNEQCLDILEKAQTLARSIFPYFNRGIYALRFKIDPEKAVEVAKDETGKEFRLPTFSVTSRFLCYVHPQAISAWMEEGKTGKKCNICTTYHEPLTKIAGVVVHEMLHPLLNHHKRAEKYFSVAFYPKIWNIAIDFEANQTLRPGFIKANRGNKEYCPLCLTEDACYPDTFAGGKYNLPMEETAEIYYELLLEKAEKSPNGEKVFGQLIGSCLSNGEGEQGAGGDGEGDGGGKPRDDMGDADGMSDLERKLLQEGTARAIKAHSKQRGNTPAGLLRWADGVLTPPKVDWRSILRNKVVYHSRRFEPGSRQTSFRKQSIVSTVLRHSLRKNVSLPTYVDPKPEVACVVDTSGSMSSADIKACVVEVQGILRSIRGDVRLVDVDCAAGKIQKVKRASDIKLGGGGGTDMRIGIEAVYNTNPRPNLIVVLTDCVTPWPDAPLKGCGLLVVGIGASATRDKVPAWADFVQVDDVG